MKTMNLSSTPEGLTLVERTAPRPTPGPEELLIRVYAAGVTPTELQWYPTLHTTTGSPRVAPIPGHEFSGVVVAAGSQVGRLEIGREVFGMNDWFADGATAEFCVARFCDVAPKPFSLTHVEAASVPIGALTAWQGLLERARLRPGERVLIQGGAGSVGSLAVQLAKWQGAYVVATAGPRNLDFVAGLGADEVIDYSRVSFDQRTEEFDVVFDGVGGETLRRSWALLKPTGRMVSIAASEEGTQDPRGMDAFFIVTPNQKQLSLISDLLRTGTLRPVVDSVTTLSQSAGAYRGTWTRRGRGKVVVAVAAAVPHVKTVAAALSASRN